MTASQDIPVGVCQCGCGERTSIALDTDKRKGAVRGQPRRFIHGHNGRLRPVADEPGANPDGLCQCGCGQKTALAKRTNWRPGHIKGKPLRYISGHQGHKPVKWIEEDCGYKTPCWIWQLHINDDGYGSFSIHIPAECGMPKRVKSHKAHRYVYEQRVGPIPAGLQLDHLCFNPSCVNPDHLEPVTNAENARRSRSVKLSHEKAQAIRALLSGGADAGEIARNHGVHPGTIYAIGSGRTWRKAREAA